jgi:hypothetical protein
VGKKSGVEVGSEVEAGGVLRGGVRRRQTCLSGFGQTVKRIKGKAGAAQRGRGTEREERERGEGKPRWVCLPRGCINRLPKLKTPLRTQNPIP